MQYLGDGNLLVVVENKSGLDGEETGLNGDMMVDAPGKML
jgi:hypothetical protein